MMIMNTMKGNVSVSIKVAIGLALVFVLFVFWGAIVVMKQSPGGSVEVVVTPTPETSLALRTGRPSDLCSKQGNVYRTLEEALQNKEAVCDVVVSDVSVFPEELASIPNLRQLALTGGKLVSVPVTIEKFSQLLTFSVANNPQLQALPPEIGKLQNLWVLDITNTGIKTLPPEIRQLTNLRMLILTKGSLQAAQLQTIREALPGIEIREVTVPLPPSVTPSPAVSANR